AQTYRHFELTRDPVSARGDYVVTLAAGDTLAPDALYRFARRAEAKPEIKFIYADEDSLAGGRRANPVLKPDFTEITALSYDLFGAPVAVSKALYDACASPNMKDVPAPGESYAFALRCLARCGGAEHIARVLLTRAVQPEPSGATSGCEAVEHYLARTNQECGVSSGLWRGSFHVMAKPKKKDALAVIIPNRDGADELRRLLESIEETSAFYKPGIIIADAGSTSERTLKYYEILEKNKAARVVNVGGAGFSRLCNAACDLTSAEHLLFLARDAELFTPDLVGELRAQASRRGVGAVGCRLLDENGRLVHAGYVVGLCGAVGSPYAGETETERSMRRLRIAHTVRGVSAVSGACLLVRSDVFRSAGGFDESMDDGNILPCGADIEFCVRLLRRGFVNVYTPYARAVLHAKLPRIEDAAEKVRVRCYDALRPMLAARDPYFNRNYSRRSSIPTIRTEPEDEPPERF
ncbi:MAG TPA: glycosyltransferase, partial [Clostridia bacterium]|nr:glycosyltransferase [Clostridia bacterium]